jgi:prepilin-type N-terminal cleavage/methylation domain-containing protein
MAKGVLREWEPGKGFTLIELSIVLVIIGLITGGVLVGKDLINAAGMRAQISQAEKYNSAVNAFRSKYGGVPGDLNSKLASQFGFAPRGQYAGEGDGNGVIEGIYQDQAGWNMGIFPLVGETVLFWMDLSQAGLIEGRFTAGSATTISPAVGSSAASLDPFLPHANIGGGNYIYVWSGGYLDGGPLNGGDGMNYFGLSVPDAYGVVCGNCLLSHPGLSVEQAYNIDTKIDDGKPQSGRVMAMYIDALGYPNSQYTASWAAGGGLYGDFDSGTNGPVVAGDNISTAPTDNTCYDNSNVSGGTEQYSMGQNNGSGLNCALSFKFQ